MPDDSKPKPPRPYPPPLPPQPLIVEPFPLASDEPPRSIRMRSTPPSGSMLLRREVEGLSDDRRDDPRDETIREMRQVNIILREKLAALSMPNTLPSPVPPPVSIRTMTKRELAKVSGQWTFLFTVAALALPIAAKQWPAYAEIIEYVRSLLP